MRIGITINAQKFENNDNFQFIIDDKSDNGGFSFVPTFDYYFNKNKFRPTIGLGIGYYLLATYIDVYPAFIANPSENIMEGRANKQIGFLLRGDLN